MKRLTEEMVIARTKISDMTKVKRLNCWGSELADVSLLRRMPNVEVLSLSINKICGLSDFEYCRQLQELYVRQNEIWNLNQVCYLQNLANLKHLWLGENPCANAEGYRLAVIRALPQLQKLDNVIIQPEELSDALKKGQILVHPDEQTEPEQQPHYEQTSGYRSPRTYNDQEVEHEAGDPGDFYENDERREYDSPTMQDYSNGDKQYNQYRQHEGSDESNSFDLPRREHTEKNSCPVNHRPPFHRRPVTRNSNILSAVLCLVKELDYPSLEVIEMAVRCRMDEINE